MSYNGVLVVNKPQGFTSHDVVAKLRGILHERRIGHGGTLDPMATGVLPVFVGAATRASEYASAQVKAYIAGFQLGFSTDTQDITGEKLQASDKKVSYTEVLHALNAMVGVQQQLPPMYSAIKIDGQKLYDLARKGVEVERERREITLLELELLSFDDKLQKGEFRVLCSKGTYVRTICNDLGEALGTYGVMSSLVRTKSGEYTLEHALSLDDIQKLADDGRVEHALRPTDSIFMDLPEVRLDDYGRDRAFNGAFISKEHAPDMPLKKGQLSRVYYQDEFIMLGRTDTLKIGGLALFTHKRFV